MEQAAILKSGNVVKLTGLINPKYTIYGFLNSFETVVDGVTKKFKETVKEDFRAIDLAGQIDKDVIGGFYEETFFLEYFLDETKEKLHQLKNHKYTFKSASAGDEIIVKKLKVASPYTDFCKIETYKWLYQPNVPIVDYATWQISIPPEAFPNLVAKNIELSSTAMQFYSHKIGLFVTPLSDVNDKQAKAFLLAKMAIQIHSIENIFNLVELNIDTDFGRYINSQRFEWSNQPIFANPTISVLEDYMLNLTHFYKSFYANYISIKKATKREQFYWLARCLSAEALATVPSYDKVNLLKKISDYSHLLTEWNNGEELALKIIQSFTFDSVSAAERNYLLQMLMEIQVYQLTNTYNQKSTYDTKQTLFEVLYLKIDDNRTGRYNFGPLEYTFGLLETEDNRKKFILMLYQIWKKSEYNPIYADPSYSQPANIFGVYPESYYMKLVSDEGNTIQRTKYYDNVTSPAILAYDSATNHQTDSSLISTTDEYILGEIKGKKIEIRKKSTTRETNFKSLKENNQRVTSFTYLYGTYDLYQPISIIGFKPDSDLVETFKDPETQINLNNPIPNIPVFFLYYMQDYSDLKKIDFGLALVYAVATSLSGIGALNNLKYLTYLSKVRSVYTGTATAAETVLFWRAVEGSHNAVTFTADNLSSLNDYINTTTTDPDIKAFTEKANVWFNTLAVVTLSTDIIVKKKLFDATADLMLEEVKLIEVGKSSGLNAEVMNAIKSVYDAAALITEMLQKLNNLPSNVSNNIIDRFNTFTDEEKYDFFVCFFNLKKRTDWAKLNFLHTRIVNGIPKQYNLVDIWENEIKFLKNQRTVDFLEAYRIISNSNEIEIGIFKGQIKSKLLKKYHNSAPPYTDNQYQWIAKGVHHNDAIQNGTAVIIGNTTTVGPQGLGYYKAKVKIYDPNCPINGGWIIKKKNSTFFPNTWTKQKLHEELAFAYNNRALKNGHLKGRMSDNVEVVFYTENGIIKSVYPSFN
ncbi:EndoU domain-containing protein [Flavobacterium poyangense]|uniref:EndoU domain-containing protein n=1 Tax=Flavobacterium poyangense TaxID=2204302 RepID=UPI00142460B3|nr:EndoU domain-containing protein [Flavobacterium sp. JXAS1]